MSMPPTAPPTPEFYPPPHYPPPYYQQQHYPQPQQHHAPPHFPPQYYPSSPAAPPPPPPPPQRQPEIPRTTTQDPNWSTGLCDCFSDMNSCCLVCWCPCIAFGRIAEIVDKGTSSCCCCGSLFLLLGSLGVASAVASWGLGAHGRFLTCQWILSCLYRGKLKQDFNIPASCCEDCCTHFWCEPCGLCQEYRELQIRGYDLSLGWHGNLNKQNAASSNVRAPVVPSMYR